jgi:hypothetical protein
MSVIKGEKLKQSINENAYLLYYQNLKPHQLPLSSAGVAECRSPIIT